MPFALAPPQPNRFKPTIQRVETENYNRHTRGVLDKLSHLLNQSTFLTVKYGLFDAEAELYRISKMESNWDTYGADPPSADAIGASRDILRDLAANLILPSTIVPSAGGGVSIYFMNGDQTVYIESYNQGSQALVMYDQHGNTEVLELDSDIPRSAVSGRILEYLG
jgi:hypothetical protein